MQWYWWLLIAVAVVGIGYLKLKVWGKMIENAKKRKAEREKLMEED